MIAVEAWKLILEGNERLSDDTVFGSYVRGVLNMKVSANERHRAAGVKRAMGLYSKPIFFKGVEYPSINAAVRESGSAYTTVVRNGEFL